MAWHVVFHPDFDPEFDALAPDVQDELLAHAKLLEAFDPERKAVLLVAADKSGVAERRLYRRLIGKADERFDRHLDRLQATRRTK